MIGRYTDDILAVFRVFVLWQRRYVLRAAGLVLLRAGGAGGCGTGGSTGGEGGIGDYQR